MSTSYELQCQAIKNLRDKKAREILDIVENKYRDYLEEVEDLKKRALTLNEFTKRLKLK